MDVLELPISCSASWPQKPTIGSDEGELPGTTSRNRLDRAEQNASSFR